MAAVELVMEKQGPNNSSGKHPGGGVTISRRPKKAVIESDSEDESSASVCPSGPPDVDLSSQSGGCPINYSMDISQLEAPTFTTLDRGPCRSMMMLKWDHGVNLIGKKVLNPVIHCCDKCLKPILIYGRMIPCKHVFCLKCAQSEKNGCCSRCGEKVSHVDHAGLGSIYMCSHGGSRYGNNGCRRTYLSQRDLQAHIRHRHLKSESSSAVASSQAPPQTTPSSVPSAAANRVTPAPPQLPPPLLKQPPTGYSPRIMTAPPIHQQVTQPISVISSNRTASNLITVPIEGGEQNGGDHYAASATAGGYAAYNGASGQYAAAPPYPNYSHPPPNYPPTSAVTPATDPTNYYSNYENAYNGSYRTPNPGAAPPGGGAPTSYYRR